MNHNIGRVCVVAAGALWLAGCSDSPTPTPKTAAVSPKKAPEAPAGPVSGKTALYALDKEARVWAKDRLLISLVSSEVPSMPSEAGKYPMWTAVFVSELRGQAHNMIYSMVDQPPMINKGITVKGESSWGGQRQDALAFEISDAPVDSEAAYATALHKAVGWVSRNPGKKPVFTLGYSGSLPAPSWYILWGTRSNGYAAFVNAQKGTVIER